MEFSMKSKVNHGDTAEVKSLQRKEHGGIQFVFRRARRVAVVKGLFK
jgi:hypothetical protein